MGRKNTDKAVAAIQKKVDKIKDPNKKQELQKAMDELRGEGVPPEEIPAQLRDLNTLAREAENNPDERW